MNEEQNSKEPQNLGGSLPKLQKGDKIKLYVSFQLFQELYGSYVQMNDRFESVHIWSEELALRNKGRWIPILISKTKYESEKLHSWNN